MSCRTVGLQSGKMSRVDMDPFVLEGLSYNKLAQNITVHITKVPVA